MKKIILLTDYSETSRKAFHFTLRLLADHDCLFTVLHSYAELPIATEMLDDQMSVRAQQKMDEFIGSFKAERSPADHLFEGKALEGNLFLLVEDLQARHAYDLVVVGASGAGNSVRLGSVATQIVRTVTCPVLVVPLTATCERINSFVLATNYTNFGSVRVFDLLRALLRKGQSTLTFLSILSKGDSMQEAEATGQSLLDEYFKGYMPIHHYLQEESPIEGIETYLANHKTDLLITVSHHRSIWDILLNRSTSRILAYRAEVPLLVLTEVTPYASEDLPSSEWGNI